jgi:hypothetical protein
MTENRRKDKTMIQSGQFGRILCSLGFHKWGKKFGFDEYGSNVIDWKSRCERCGKLKKWVEARPKRN